MLFVGGPEDGKWEDDIPLKPFFTVTLIGPGTPELGEDRFYEQLELARGVAVMAPRNWRIEDVMKRLVEAYRKDINPAKPHSTVED